MASQLLGIKTRFTNDLGSPLLGGQVYTYFSGTSTNQDSYSDAALTVPNTNPVILDDTGSADIFLKGAYRIRVFDKSGRFIEEQDNITQAASQGDATEISERLDAVQGDLEKVKLDTGITATAKSGGIVERTQADKNAEYTTVKDFGAIGDGIADDSEAFINAGQTTGVVIINTGTYKVNGTIPTNCKFIGHGDAVINLTVDGTQGDKGFWIKTSGCIASVTIRREVIGSGADGSINNAILVGDYYNPTGIETKNWLVKDVRLEGILEHPSGLGRRNIFAVLGNCHHGIVEKVAVTGYATTGLQLHWGGEFDPNDPHKSIVTKSWHPRYIDIYGFTVSDIQPDMGVYGILLSAVHDVSLTNFNCSGVDKPLGIGVGDIGAEVAQGESKHSLLKNIVIKNFTASNWKEAALLLWGRSGTRLGGDKRWFATDTDCSISFDNVQLYRGAESSSYAIDMWFMSGIKMRNLFIGNEKGKQLNNKAPALFVHYCRDIDVKGRIVAPQATYLHSVIDSSFHIDDTCPVSTYESEHMGTRLTALSLARTLDRAVAVGDTSIFIKQMGNDVYEGGTVTIGGQIMKITASTIHYFTGVSEVFIEPSKASANAGSSVNVAMPNNSIRLTGSSHGYAVGVSLESSFNGTNGAVFINKSFYESGLYDILARDVESLKIIGCSFEESNRTKSPNGDNIRLLDDCLSVTIQDCDFEKNIDTSRTETINNIYIHSPVTNPVVKGNRFHDAKSSAIRYLKPTKDNGGGSFGDNWYSDKIPTKFSSPNVAKMIEVGGNRIGYSGAIPDYGKWDKGDVIYNSNPIAGGSVGWVCVAAGISGTWKAFGTIQS